MGILKTFVKIKKTFERIASLVHDNSARDAIFNALAAWNIRLFEHMFESEHVIWYNIKNNDENITRAEKRNRDNKKRKKKNKLRKILIYILIVLVVVSVGPVLSLTAFFHITDITVSGNEKYATEEIIAQCPIDIG